MSRGQFCWKPFWLGSNPIPWKIVWVRSESAIWMSAEWIGQGVNSLNDFFLMRKTYFLCIYIFFLLCRHGFSNPEHRKLCCGFLLQIITNVVVLSHIYLKFMRIIQIYLQNNGQNRNWKERVPTKIKHYDFSWQDTDCTDCINCNLTLYIHPDKCPLL